MDPVFQGKVGRRSHKQAPNVLTTLGVLWYVCDIAHSLHGFPMKDLRNDITTCFDAKQIPAPDQFVKRDGFDPFEKEDAVKFFSGKSWNDVLDHLNSLENTMIFGADYHLEEWSVLEPKPRYYYLRAFLEFLLETLSKDDPDEQFVSDLFHQLYQTIYMYKYDAYNVLQEAVLRNVAAYATIVVEEHKGFDNWRDDIIDNINRFLFELEKHG